MKLGSEKENGEKGEIFPSMDGKGGAVNSKRIFLKRKDGGSALGKARKEGAQGERTPSSRFRKNNPVPPPCAEESSLELLAKWGL